MNVLQVHTVPGNIEPTRLSDYAVPIFKNIIPTRKGIKKAILAGAIIVDGEKGQTGTWIKPNQVIQFVELPKSSPKTLEILLPLIYEDDFLAIINKPGGLPTSGNQFRTIQNALPYNLTTSKLKDALHLPRPVHRLDAPTCGLLIIAKSASAQRNLQEQFEQKSVHKKYEALACGLIPDKGQMDIPIDKKSALTYFKRLKTSRSLINEWISHVTLEPQTGRTHQLRIHLSELGFPILGDRLYGQEGKIKKGKGLFLCATELAFQHPNTKKTITFSTPPPPKFELTLQREQQMWNRANGEF